MGPVNAVSAEPLYLALYIPEFPAQARLRLRPELVHRPFAVLDGKAPLELVCSINKAALALGLTRGTTRIELDSFKDLTTARRSAVEEAAARKALLTAAGAFTPRVETYSLPSPDGLPLVMVLDMTGTERIFGPPGQTAQALLKAVRSLGLIARCSISHNFHAAVCSSAFAVRSPFLLHAGQERSSLSPLPLAALGLSLEQQSTFAMWGLKTVGDLAQLPEHEIVARLGQEGSRLWQLAHGKHPHLMIPEEPVFALEERIEFEAPEDHLESLLFVVGPLLDHMIQQARAYSLALAQLTVSFSLEGGSRHHSSFKPALPSESRRGLLKLLQLELQARPPSAAVTALHLHAKPGPRGKVQTEMFSPPLPEPMRLEEMLARVAAIVGVDRVGRAKLLDTHRSNGFVLEPFHVSQDIRRRERDSPRSFPSLAIRRLRTPEPLSIKLVANTPSAFTWKQKCYIVKQACGPWKSSGNWWSETVWSCEEWDVRAVSKADETFLGILRLDQRKDLWLLEALYD